MRSRHQQLVRDGNVLPIARAPFGSSMTPTLDEIADRPEVASHLSQATVMTILYRAIAVQHACFAELVATWAAQEIRRTGQDVPDLLTASEVARMMGGISARQVYRQARQFPFSTFSIRPTPGTVRFHRHLVEQYLRDPDAYRVRHAGAARSDSCVSVPSSRGRNGRS